MLWWLDTMMAGPSTSKFSSPFTSNLRPKKYLKVLTTVLMILGKRKEKSGQTAAGQGCNGVCCTVQHQKVEGGENCVPDSLRSHLPLVHLGACPA